MNIKFTPGPWVKDFGGTIGHIKSIAKRDGYGTPTVCKYIYDLQHHAIKNEEEIHANAKLIAAAPDLLEALQELIDGMSDIEDSESKVLQRSKAAIAKALGEQG